MALLWSAEMLLAAGPEAPIDLGPGQVVGTGINYASAAVTYPDGTLESFFRRTADGHVSIFRTRSMDNGHSWSEPDVLVHLTVEPWGGPMPLLDRDGELHFVIPKVRGEGRKPAVDRFIDLYHLRSRNGRTQWTKPRRIFEGYCGAIQGVFQLSSGRIIAPFADWLPNVPTTPPTGPSETTCVYSDDGGETWHRSPARLTAPCFDGYNGANYGACEPTLLELRDGRVWMLLRTQAGSMYESFSTDGVQWSAATASRFPASNSPAFPIRLADGRIVVFWNNCVMPPRVDGAGVYAGRDALHAAISADEGQTWRGFREVYRDPTRNGSPPKDGDRGTAYPHATLTQNGQILLVSGQGENRRRRFLIDPEWLLETHAAADFSNLDGWHVFKAFGPVERWWQDRAQGPQLVEHPDQPGAKVLHLRRPDKLAADGASWNFPAGRSGRLLLSLKVQPGFGGAQVSLADRYYNPCDDQGEEQAAYSVVIEPTGRISEAALQPGRWHQLGLAWQDGGPCDITLDGQLITSQSARAEAPNGLSYLRLRSRAQDIDPVGFLVEAVQVDVD